MRIDGKTGDEPRVYRTRPVFMVFFLIVGGAMLTVGVVLPFLSIKGSLASLSSALLMTSVAEATGLWIILAAIRFKVVLWGDIISCRYIFTTREIRRDDIKSYRIIVHRGDREVVFIPKASSEKLVRTLTSSLDERFWRWLDGIPHEETAATAT